VVVSTRVVGRWLGWWAIASGLGLVIARFFWTSKPLASAVRRLLDLDDHHVHPACPQAARGAEGGRRACQP
jgi:hypothetical protein